MTEPKRILRPRRAESSSTKNDIPQEVEVWFAAGCPVRGAPWPALLPPTHGRLPEWWAKWKAGHPHARPDSAAVIWLEPTQ
jgi:hypothetical protein